MAGETVATTALNAPFEGAAGLFLVPFTVAFASGALELADITEAGYVPANVTVYGAFMRATDMDTNVSPLLAQKLTLGSTDIITAITYGQTGADGFRACVPVTTTAKTKLVVNNTAAAATAAGGTLYIALLCQK